MGRAADVRAARLALSAALSDLRVASGEAGAKALWSECTAEAEPMRRRSADAHTALQQTCSDLQRWSRLAPARRRWPNDEMARLRDAVDTRIECLSEWCAGTRLMSRLEAALETALDHTGRLANV